ncbi:transcriptional regulator [Longispora fulva]|uniref:DNA-binding MarR family transcriptional regulator n=1 Tax=Longispora fulva TaxID=619741 RepID=A0A8J7GF27_9ACTN|nr:helix-turn-helix domain-containing protein [Longispora fulva]MBG6139473.1 DNA-binding MarR family transcriptional regulator [Longispora fulva]GIG58144.1 transcriptional regulator [Longispora fulva]
MTGSPLPPEVTDLEALRTLAHPRRHRILQHLEVHGPATATTLAAALGENTGATSYHLRELARYGFVAEVPDLAHGRERWWKYTERRLPLRDQQDQDMRPVLHEVTRLGYSADLDLFAAAQAARDATGEWAEELPYDRDAVELSYTELIALQRDYQELLASYRDRPRPADARTVHLRFLAFPAPR